MSPIPLTVILHGLLALVPTQDSNNGHLITALLLDARSASGMECMSQHSPNLRFDVPHATQIQCSSAGCALTGLTCSCTDALAGKKVSFEITPAPDLSVSLPKSRLFLPELPAAPADAGDFSYVANLALPPFGQVLNPNYLTTSPPQNLLARIDVPFHTVTACALAAREDEGESHIQPFSFHKLHVQGKAGEGSQAVAQVAVAQVDVPDAGGGTQQVILHISSPDGTNDHAIVLDPGSNGFLVDLANDATVLDRDEPCEDGVARHFAMLYEFAATPPAMPDRLIPHARFSNGKKASDFQLPICNLPFKNPMDRPVCPIATFNP
jgi:hypothetical protein